MYVSHEKHWTFQPGTTSNWVKETLFHHVTRLSVKTTKSLPQSSSMLTSYSVSFNNHSRNSRRTRNAFLRFTWAILFCETGFNKSQKDGWNRTKVFLSYNSLHYYELPLGGFNQIHVQSQELDLQSPGGKSNEQYNVTYLLYELHFILLLVSILNLIHLQLNLGFFHQ